jgi:carbon monoxide dehydrogenase subunit G
VKIDGSFVIAAPLRPVWDALLDPSIVGPCIPGCSEIEVLSPQDYRATVTLEVGPIRANFAVVVAVTEIAPYESVKSITKGEEGSRASVLSSVNIMSVKVIDSTSTEVSYSSEVSVTGRLGKFGLGLMKKKAEKVAADFARNLQTRLLSSSAVARSI